MGKTDLEESQAHKVKTDQLDPRDFLSPDLKVAKVNKVWSAWKVPKAVRDLMASRVVKVNRVKKVQ